MAPTSDPRDRIETWKSIAAHVGRSISWCQRMARRGRQGRLPVWYIHRGAERGRPCILASELLAWLNERKADISGPRPLQ